MKRIITFCFLAFFSLLIKSQTGNYWLQSEGSPNVDENIGLAKDNNNNLITVGYFTNTITFPDLTTLTSYGAGTNDALIQKTNSSGQKQWAVKAGGMGSDRATAVACDASGNIYVAGYYYGSAQFGSFTLNSVSGSQDIFIAKLDASGTFLWVRSAGGTMGEDPYSITVDNSGNVIVTGEFQGTSTFGTTTLTSITNPYINLPSFDVFTCKYDNSGNFLWVKQGAAHLNDRGTDVGTDASGNIFVCGQFSDTITFDNTHLNTIQNAVFIIKYNAAGQEQWFVRAGGISSIANALAIDNNNNVYVTGDYTGNIIFFGTPNNTLTGAYSNRIFLVKYSNSGTYLWGKEDASSSPVSSRDVALDANQNPCMFGEFNCTMSDYSILAGGTGLFNSIGYQDLFLCQYDNNGNRLWARNFGGAYNDYAHGIVFTNNTTPYVCGSFNHKLFVDTKYNPFNVISNLYPGSDSWVSYHNCNNYNYYYHHTISAGFSDCFLLHGVDSTSAYYDYYYRNGTECQKDFVGGCIDDYAYNCPDTIPFCGSGNIITNPYTGDIGGVGPFYHYQWNTGDTTQSKNVTASGNYSCVMTTIDGCYTSEDTVYVKINPVPAPPNITDNLGINVNQPPATHPIVVCGAQTFTLTGSNIQGCNYIWSGPGIVSTNSTSCVVNQAGTYYFTLTNSYGCSNTNSVTIQFDTLNHVVPKTNMPDSFTVCRGDCIPYFIYDSLSNPTAINPYNPFTSLIHVNTVNSSVAWCCSSNSYNNLSLSICPVTSGTINLHTQYIFSSLCGNDTAYFNKVIYVKVNPLPQVSISLVGNTFICPHDSSLLVASVTVTPGANITYTVSPNDSIWVTQAGYYSVSLYAQDTVTHCHNSIYSYAYVQTVNNPNLYTIPASGIICPNDSVQLICTWPNAVSWQWYGPSGIMTATTSAIYEHIPGFYYCVATNSNGCQLTSNTIEIKQYTTPYLLALPQAVVCAGQTVVLQIVSGDTNDIHWLSPLSGTGTIRYVSQTGVYSCEVTACGITTTCSVAVTVSQPTANISVSGSTTICPGDSLLLTANTGMISYQWLPTNQTTDSIYALASGTYVLVATDANGCVAEDSVNVYYNPSAPTSPTTSNDSICYGSMANLHATTTGTNTIQWYAQPYSGSVIHTGSNFTTPPLYVNTSYYVSNEDASGCHSVRTEVEVFIKPTSLPPIINAGQDSLCYGDILNLYANSVSGATYNWSGPNAFTSSQQNPQINAVTAAASGTYSLFISGSGCVSPTATINITVTQVSTPIVSFVNDSICAGSSLVFQAQSASSGVSYTWVDPSGNTISQQTFTITNAAITNAGIYTLQTNIGVCKSVTDTVHVYVKPVPHSALIHTQTVFCTGDNIALYAHSTPTTSTVYWTGPNNFTSSSTQIDIDTAQVYNSGYYVCSTSLNGCTSKDSVNIMVNQMPIPSVTDTFACGASVAINATYPNAVNYTWSDGNSDSIHVITTSGTYWVTYVLGTSCVFTDTFHITVQPNDLMDELPNIVTPNNDTTNEYIDYGKYHFAALQIDIYDRWGVKIFESSDPNAIWRPTCVDGTYFYIIQYKISCLSENNSGTRRGFITVVR